MSKEALEAVIDRTWEDGEYLIKLIEWPDEVQEEYSLSDDEIDALRSGNMGVLKELGVDEGHLERVPKEATQKGTPSVGGIPERGHLPGDGSISD